MRKGSLSISTNAIVVLIVAVIMLGLIIGLVTRGFNLVESRFFEAIEANEPAPTTPTLSQPITLSADSRSAERGKQLGLKIGVLNPGTNSLPTGGTPPDSSVVDIAPFIECNGGVLDVTTIQVNPTKIDINERVTFTYVVQVSDTARQGSNLCKVVMKTYSQDSATLEWTVDPICAGTTGANAISDYCDRFSRAEFTINI